MNPTAPTFPTLTDRERQFPAMPAEADGFPDGWVVRLVPRLSSSSSNNKNNYDDEHNDRQVKIDKLFYSPNLGLKFRSKPDARRFLDCLEDANENEAVAVAASRLLKNSKSPSESSKSTSSNTSSARLYNTGTLRAVCNRRSCTRTARHGYGGLCSKHYASPKTKIKCSHASCNHQAVAGGLCRKHGPRCSMEGCGHAVYSRGICQKHWQRERNNEVTNVIENQEEEEVAPVKKLEYDSESTILEDGVMVVNVNSNGKRRRISRLDIVDLTDSSLVEADNISNVIRETKHGENPDGGKQAHLNRQDKTREETTTNANRNTGEPHQRNNERRVLSLPPEMKARLASFLPRKRHRKGGVGIGDIASKIEGFVAVCRGVPGEEVLKANFPNELDIEIMNGESSYFLRDCGESRSTSKQTELQKLRHQQQKRSHEETEQNPRLLTEEMKEIIRPHIPRFGKGSRGVSISFIHKKVGSFIPRFCFEGSFLDELEIEEIDGAKMYLLRPPEKGLNNSNSGNPSEEEAAAEKIPLVTPTDHLMEERLACDSLESVSSISTVNSQQKNGEKKCQMNGKLIELTSGQASETKFPPGCQVAYNFKTETESSASLISIGVVSSVKISLTGNFIYEIKAGTANESEKDKVDNILINEHSLVYAPATPIHFQLTAAQIAPNAGIVLLSTRSRGIESRELRYTVLTPSDTGQHIIRHNVAPKQLSFRAISSTSQELYGPKPTAAPPSAIETGNTVIGNAKRRKNGSVSEKVAPKVQTTKGEGVPAVSDSSTVALPEVLKGSNTKQDRKFPQHLRFSSLGSVNEGEHAGKVDERDENIIADDVNIEASTGANKRKTQRGWKKCDKWNTCNGTLSRQSNKQTDKTTERNGEKVAHVVNSKRSTQSHKRKNKKSKRKREQENSNTVNETANPPTQPERKQQKTPRKNKAHRLFKREQNSIRRAEREVFYRQSE